MAYCYELERMHLFNQKGLEVVRFVRNFLIDYTEEGLWEMDFDDVFEKILAVKKFPTLMLRAAIDYLAEIGDIDIYYLYYDLKTINFICIYGKKRR